MCESFSVAIDTAARRPACVVAERLDGIPGVRGGVAAAGTLDRRHRLSVRTAAVRRGCRLAAGVAGIRTPRAEPREEGIRGGAGTRTGRSSRTSDKGAPARDGRACRVASPTSDLAAVDRLVHRATIFELNVESYRRRAAVESSTTVKRGPGRIADRATPANTEVAPRSTKASNSSKSKA